MVAGCGSASVVTKTATVTTTATAPVQGVEGPGSYSHATDAQFCSTHKCIAYFPHGRGTIVQCVDGEWSHSGGIQGACSYHRGETALGKPVPGQASPSAG